MTASALLLAAAAAAPSVAEEADGSGAAIATAPELAPEMAPDATEDVTEGAGRDDGLDDLFDALAAADADSAPVIVEKIVEEWSRSGSPSFDFMLSRGRDALDEADFQAAVSHFSALIDHAPDFAEAYHARATAFFRQKRYGLAMADLRRTLALNPRHFGALTGAALMLEEIDRPGRALEAWRAVQAINPSDEAAASGIARLARRVEGQDI